MSQVMSPTEYGIKTRFIVSPHVSGLDLVNRKLMGLDRAASGLAGSITGRLGRAFMGLAAGYGLVRLTRGLIGINSEIQDATVGIASMYNALGKMPWAQAMGAARSQLKGLRADAAAGVGELSDYVQGYSRIFPNAIRAGLDATQVRELTKMSIGVAGAQGRSLALGPMDVNQALTSGASDRTTPMVNQALAGIGMSDKQFNALAADKKGETLMRAFSQYKEGVEAFGRTFGAQFDTLKDKVKDLARSVTGPLFDHWTKSLISANEWLDKHNATLTNIAENIGPKLVRIWEKLGQHSGQIGTAAAGVGVAGAAGRVAGSTGALRLAAAAGPAGFGVAAAGAAIFALVGAAMAGAIKKFPVLGAELAASVGGLVLEFGRLAEAVVGTFGILMGNPIVVGFGSFLVTMADKFVKGVVVFTRGMTALVEFAGYAASALAMTMRGVGAMVSGRGATAYGYFKQAKIETATADAVLTNRMSHMFDPIAFGLNRKKENGDDGGDPTGDWNFNMNGPITIKIEAKRMDDPNVVAASMDEVFRRLAAYPLAGRRGLPTR